MYESQEEPDTSEDWCLLTGGEDMPENRYMLDDEKAFHAQKLKSKYDREEKYRQVRNKASAVN